MHQLHDCKKVHEAKFMLQGVKPESFSCAILSTITGTIEGPIQFSCARARALDINSTCSVGSTSDHLKIPVPNPQLQQLFMVQDYINMSNQRRPIRHIYYCTTLEQQAFFIPRKRTI